MIQKIFSALILIGVVALNAELVFAETGMLPLVRVFYRLDGGVTITYFVASACLAGETEIQCMDRISLKNSEYGRPYDDVPMNQLPQDRTYRDKWRGEKGRGIWIDESLVTKREKIEELEKKLDEEFEKDNPDSGKIIKIQRHLEKAKKIKTSVLTSEDLAIFEEKQQSFIATAINAIGSVFEGILNGIKEGFLALKNLVTEKIQIGTPEKPAGITIYDFETKEPFCLIVRGGKVDQIPGECTFEAAPSPNSNGQQQSQQNQSQNQNQNNGQDNRQQTQEPVQEQPALTTPTIETTSTTTSTEPAPSETPVEETTAPNEPVSEPTPESESQSVPVHEPAPEEPAL